MSAPEPTITEVSPAEVAPATEVTDMKGIPTAEPVVVTQAEHAVDTPVPSAEPAPAPSTTTSIMAVSPAEETTKTETEEEPQNTLTAKFSAVEWTALEEFRKQLPEMFIDAFSDKKENKDAPITLWGVAIDPHKPSEDARISVVLMKFLRARNLNVKAAREMFVATLRWRDEIDIDSVMKEEFPQDVFGSLGYNYLTDKEGRPVSYNVYGGSTDTKAVFSDVRRFIRWRVQFMEKTVGLCDFTTVDQTVQIHDYAGTGMSNRDANSKQAASEASNIFGSHYPELLYKKFFINVSSIMAWVFWVFKAFIPSATFAKMNMIGSSTHEIKKALLPLIDEKNLPKRYGGLAEGF